VSLKLGNQTAIVTGANRGIGRAISEALAREGAHVVLIGRNPQAIAEASNQLNQKGLSSSFEIVDMAVADQVERAFESIIARRGRVDILVNNAGVGHLKPAVELTLSEFDEMWNLNMRSVFVATKATLPVMLKAKSGVIVNIASLAGKNGFKGGTGYGATKWALRGFASSLMLEVRDRNVRVVTIFPGSVDTAFSTTGKRGERVTQPEDVADAVVFAVTAPGRSMVSEIDIRPTNP
jgi:NADP-dependent 3-hydroxy acid dehydrogenase YdfG